MSFPRKLPILIVCCLIVGLVHGQERKILGRVLDHETKKPIYNANVVLFGTSRGAVSNAGGFFELTINADAFFLTVSYVGYRTTQIPIPTEDKFMFYLDRERTFLPTLFLEDYPKSPGPVKEAVVKKAPEGFQVVEELAAFPGGMDQFYTFIGNALARSISRKPTGLVKINFTIDPDGKPVDIGVSDSSAVSLREVLSAFVDMPAWIPASQRQVKVPQEFTLPFRTSRAASAATQAFLDYFANTIRYPLQARRMGIEGQVIVEFKIEKGALVVTLMFRDIGADCGAEVVGALGTVPSEVLNAMGDGRFILPVNFGLEAKYEKEFKPNFADVVALPTVYVTAMSFHQDRRVGSSAVSTPKPTKKNEFSDLNQALQNASQAEVLILVNQELESIPEGIGQLSKLKKLDLEGNRLTALSPEISSLNSLKELYLFSNRFEEVPPGISHLSNLVVLGLARNTIKEISDEMNQLKKLEALDLSDNRIEVLPASISKLKRLRVLNLKGNLIRNLPPEFYTLPALEKLDLTGNPLDPGLIDFIRSKLHGTVVYY